MTTRIDGKAFAERVREQVAHDVAALQAQHQLTPGLAVVLVGEDPASEVYVRNKGKQTAAAGMHSVERKLPANTSQDELMTVVAALNDDPTVNGILVQLPLPEHIDADAVINAISQAKDVDGFHLTNIGMLWSGGREHGAVYPARVPDDVA